MEEQKESRSISIPRGYLKDVLWLFVQIGAIMYWALSVNTSLLAIKEKMQDQKLLNESNNAELKERVKDLENCLNRGRC